MKNPRLWPWRMLYVAPITAVVALLILFVPTEDTTSEELWVVVPMLLLLGLALMQFIRLTIIERRTKESRVIGLRIQAISLSPFWESEKMIALYDRGEPLPRYRLQYCTRVYPWWDTVEGSFSTIEEAAAFADSLVCAHEQWRYNRKHPIDLPTER